MAPTVLRTNNLQVKIYPKDHGPPHVHVIGPDIDARFRLKDMKCTESKGLSRKDLKQLQEFLRQNRELLEEAWNAYQE